MTADIWSLGIILWCLLTSYALYEIPSLSDPRYVKLTLGKKGIQALLCAFQVKGVPDSAVDLLSLMLNVDPSKRPSIHEVLAHDFLTSHEHKSLATPPSTTSIPACYQIDVLQTTDSMTKVLVNKHVSEATSYSKSLRLQKFKEKERRKVVH